MTIPCVTGPYTNVSAKLTLESSRIRQTPTTEPEIIPGNAASIATSSAQADSGLFELNFRDERFLPFEGVGAISTWRLELSGKWQVDTDAGDREVVQLPQFDFNTISDVIFHVNYTAKEAEDGGTFKNEVIRGLQASIDAMVGTLEERRTGLYRLLSLRHEFPSQIHRFLHPVPDETVHETSLTIEKRHFPYFVQGKELAVQEIYIVVKPKDKSHRTYLDGSIVQLARVPLSSTLPDIALAVDYAEDNPAWGGLPVATVSGLSGSPDGEWMLRLDPAMLPDELVILVEDQRRLNHELIDDIFLVVRYTIGSRL
jgi:hypothetical protein